MVPRNPFIMKHLHIDGNITSNSLQSSTKITLPLVATWIFATRSRNILDYLRLEGYFTLLAQDYGWNTKYNHTFTTSILQSHVINAKDLHDKCAENGAAIVGYVSRADKCRTKHAH